MTDLDQEVLSSDKLAEEVQLFAYNNQFRYYPKAQVTETKDPSGKVGRVDIITVQGDRRVTVSYYRDKRSARLLPERRIWTLHTR